MDIYSLAGDFLVVDNATVHNGEASAKVLSELLDVFGVTLVYLPAYSPELNPCELVFSVMKSHIRNHRLEDASVPNETVQALAGITKETIERFYLHCIYPKVVLPDLTQMFDY